MVLQVLDIVLPFLLFCLSIQQIRSITRSAPKLFIHHYFLVTLNLMPFIFANAWLASALYFQMIKPESVVPREYLVLYVGIPFFIIGLIICGIRPVYLGIKSLYLRFK